MSEAGTLISETRQRARKVYQCDDCNWQIHKGEMYARACLVYDGHKYTWRRCESCDQWASSELAPLFAGMWELGYGETVQWLAETFEHADGWIYIDDEQRRAYQLGGTE